MSGHVLATRPSHALAVLAMVGSAACWGLATVMSKAALAAIAPFSLLAIQLSASVAFLWLAVLVTRAMVPRGRPALKAASTGLFEPGLAYGIGVPGLALTTAANASLISAMEPALILIVAWLLLAQRPTRALLAALAVATLGVALVTLADLSGAGAGDLRGDLLVLLGTLFAAIYVVTSSRLVAGVAPISLAALQQSVGLGAALAFVTVAVVTGFETLPDTLSPGLIAFAAASGIVQYALAFWLYLIGMQRLPVAQAGLFLTLIPVFGVSGAMVFLGETLTLVQALGAVFIVGAILAMLRRPS
jgi:drug/metabolite transporter (DMT)-like permease